MLGRLFTLTLLGFPGFILTMTSRFFNRDLSWLEFNRRVLTQATSRTWPLLERVRFFSIFANNLDEFFMKRAGYLHRLIHGGVTQYGPDGVSPTEIMGKIRERVMDMLASLKQCFRDEIIPALKKEGIYLLQWAELSEKDKSHLTMYFQTKVFPVLTPLALDPAHPFPFLSNLSTSIGIKLHRPGRKDHLFARIKLPNVLPQWVEIPDLGESPPGAMRFVRLQEVVSNNLRPLFPEMVIETIVPFRVTRNAAIEQIAEEGEEIMDLVEEELRQRRTAQVVRVEYGSDQDPWILETLQNELGLALDYFYPLEDELYFNTLKEIADINRADLKFKPFHAETPKVLQDESADLFRTIRERDIFLHHPYHSFTHTVERFLRAAVEDHDVYAIKMILYRTGEHSVFIPWLIAAAEKGKQVVCVVELKARFDEAQNIFWGEMLEKAGVHVVYGIVGLKTHAKATLVVRKEQDDFKYYAHLSSGNYNATTAKLYTDVGILTASAKITTELIEIFNYLTGLSLKKNYKTFLVAPINMREQFEALISQEIENQKKGLPAHIIAKMNSLEDQGLCELLYAASCAGVKIDLLVRGFCCLVPQRQGMSENIRVFSTIGRFLEHSRIFYFRSGSKNPRRGKVFLGSADWMYRNLNNRVETIVPVEDLAIRQSLWNTLQIMLKDTAQAWELQETGNYTFPPKRTHPELGAQEQLIQLAKTDFQFDH